MAVVSYTCDTCKRDIDVPQVIDGLEIMSRCIITNGCKGKLVQTGIKSSYIQGKLPAPDPTGLQDWLPRRVYYKLYQTVALRLWKVVHNLGTNPSLQVHIKLPDGTLIETTDYTVQYVDPFEVHITFTESRTGVVQCFARSSVTDTQRETILTQQPSQIPLVNITGGKVLSLAVPLTFDLSGIKIGFISGITGQLISLFPITFTTDTSPLSPWWKQQSAGVLLNKVFFAGKSWNVQTTRLDDDINANPLIVDGSTFFLTNTKSFPLLAADTSQQTFLVSGFLDITQLPAKTLKVVGSKGNDKEYQVINSTQTATGDTIISVSPSIEISEIFARRSKIVVDYPIQPSSVYVLLSDDPYTAYDKDTTHIIDASKLSLKSSLVVTTQVSGILFVRKDQQQVVYPAIMVM
jgi:hypothetical protein